MMDTKKKQAERRKTMELLTDWRFAVGEKADCLLTPAARSVALPHTWSVEPGLEDYTGKGWYRTVLRAQEGQRTFLRFRGANRDAEVYVNGALAGRHLHSGYTPFTLEITPFLRPGGDGEITVSVDNSYSSASLPYGRSFDWANDGGLYRPVECLRTGRLCFEDVSVCAQPVLLPTGERQQGGAALFGFDAALSGAQAGDTLQWALHEGAENSFSPLSAAPLMQGELPLAENAASLAPFLLPRVSFWHFDRPALYTLRLRLTAGKEISAERDVVFGFRELKVQGGAWFLNGESVRLPGMEWMPGSDPDKGAAETREDMERMLALLKESNSVLTRFHWQQDDWVYDWCDRHGLLVQEEIPFWGKQPEGDPEALWPVVCQQLRETILSHRHHPSIIAWGVGNELSGQTERVQRYVRSACAFARSLDGTRPVNYVTNTAWQCPFHDGAGDGDILCVNDYIGTWHQGLEQDGAWRELLSAHPGRAFIPSEFGLCEPAFPGGDPAREKIFLEKTNYYRPLTQIVGTVYFCLNDYRTHMGEEGKGRLRRRVHGSAGLRGETKPSYFTVQREHAPLISRRQTGGLTLTCRDDLPRYAVQGYFLQDGGRRVPVPDLRPGESWTYTGALSPTAQLKRPNGDFVLNV